LCCCCCGAYTGIHTCRHTLAYTRTRRHTHTHTHTYIHTGAAPGAEGGCGEEVGAGAGTGPFLTLRTAFASALTQEFQYSMHRTCFFTHASSTAPGHPCPAPSPIVSPGFTQAHAHPHPHIHIHTYSGLDTGWASGCVLLDRLQGHVRIHAYVCTMHIDIVEHGMAHLVETYLWLARRRWRRSSVGSRHFPAV